MAVSVCQAQLIVSECAQAVTQNWPNIVEAEDTVFNSTFIRKLTDKTATLIPHLNNLNNTDAMQAAGSLYVYTCQMSGMRALFQNQEHFAEKLVDDRPSALSFKTAKSIPALQTMLNQLVCPHPTAAPHHVRRNLAMDLIDPNAPQRATTRPQQHQRHKPLQRD